MFLYIEYKGTNPRVAPVTLHISIIIRLWNGIFRDPVFSGFRDLIKIRCGIRENAKYLDWKRDLTTTPTAGKQDSSKFRYRMGDFLPFCWELEDLVATREAESGIHQNLGTGCGIFLPVCREFEKTYVPAVTANETGESSVVSPILSCLPLRFLSAFSLRFSILRYERLFRVCNGLETRVN